MGELAFTVLTFAFIILSSIRVSLRGALAGGGTVETHHSFMEILRGLRFTLR